MNTKILYTIGHGNTGFEEKNFRSVFNVIKSHKIGIGYKITTSIKFCKLV